MPAATDVSFHVITSAALFAVALVVRGFTTNRAVKSRIRLTLGLSLAILALGAVLTWGRVSPAVTSNLQSIARLLFALAVIHTVVLVAVNPLRTGRASDRFPTIVQDAIVIGLFLIVSTFVLDEKFLTTSAVGAVVIGFALQDTLGNMFSGLAIQVEKPFHVGNWVSSSGFEGEVVEITWRATKIRTRQGNLVIVPNSEVAKQAITNFSEPAAPTRISFEIGASYHNPPNDVKATIREVLRQHPQVLAVPAPQVLLMDFASSAITYRAQFWIAEPSKDDLIRDELRTAIYYAFDRGKIEIPFPIQVQYERVEEHESQSDRADRVQRILESAALFSALSPDERRDLAHRTRERFYGNGEAIVREGEPGDSAFIIAVGQVRVTIGPDRHEVATIGQGGYFGEMSLLTGDPRTATVSAASDCRVVEITAAGFREIALQNPAVLDAISSDVARRREELSSARTAAATNATVAEPAASLLSRVRRFLLRTAHANVAATKAD